MGFEGIQSASVSSLLSVSQSNIEGREVLDQFA
jgi:hypothetical protein